MRIQSQFGGLRLAGLLLALSSACLLGPVAAQQDLLPRADPAEFGGKAAQVVDYIRAHPEESRAWIVLARLRLDENQRLEAAQCLEQALKLGASEPRLRFYLASLYNELKQPARAVDMLQGYLRDYPQDGQARQLLVQVRRQPCPPVELTTQEGLRPVAIHEQCYDNQEKLVAGLGHASNLQELTAASWKQVLEVLVRDRALARPLMMPTTACKLLTDDRSEVFCSEHGTVPEPCHEGARPPRLTRVHVTDSVLERAVYSSEPAMALAAAKLLRRDRPPNTLPLLTLGLAQQSDPTVLLGLLNAVPAGERSADFALHIAPLARHPDLEVRLAALRASRAVGTLLKATPEDAMVLALKAANAEEDEEFALDTLVALGPAGIPKLSEALLDEKSGITTPLVVRAMARLPDRQVVHALVEALGNPERKFRFYGSDLRRALQTLSGTDFGYDVQAWKKWAREKYPQAAGK